MDSRQKLHLVNRNIMAMGLLLQKCLEEEEKEKKNRSYWFSPYLRKDDGKGQYAEYFENLVQNPKMFIDNFHMSYQNFGKLFKLLEAHLRPKCTNPEDIPAQAKLAVVLEYFACGDIQRHFQSSYRISKSRMGDLIDLVSNAICTELRGEIPAWRNDDMLQYAQEFEDAWSFPNCVGAIDGRLVAIKDPPNSDSIFYDAKALQSIVLLAVCNASYSFTYINVGAYGSEGDLNIFTQSSFGMHVLCDQLEFPKDRVVGQSKLPYFLVGDDGFPLCKRLIKPYGGRTLGREELIFNYRLSQARRCIKKTLGIMSWKWACVQNNLLCKPERAQQIVSACCLLHNFLMRVGKDDYIGERDWRNSKSLADASGIGAYCGRSQDYAKYVRDCLKKYFCGEGSVPWQHNFVQTSR